MKMKLATIAAATMLPLAASAQAGAGAIINGVPWYDDRDSVVSAHGANIVADGGRYYMFGENKTDSANTFTGFSCYSSANLVDWKFERIALKTQAGGRLGPGRVGERPKVMRCPKTGEYVMLMHSDDLRYKDPCVAYATSDSINGEYTFRGPLLYKGKPIRKWDIGSFVDDDGQAYLLVHHGYIYRLAPDFHSADSCLTAGVKGAGESPAMFKHDGTYYWLSSHTTSWERNDNMYHTSKSLSGPWQLQGPFCPEGSLTHNSQTTYVLPLTIEGRQVPMFMGDRWSFPKQHSAATYVWMPITMENGRMSIPELWQAWNPQTGRQADIGMHPVGRRGRHHVGGLQRLPRGPQGHTGPRLRLCPGESDRRARAHRAEPDGRLLRQEGVDRAALREPAAARGALHADRDGNGLQAELDRQVEDRIRQPGHIRAHRRRGGDGLSRPTANAAKNNARGHPVAEPARIFRNGLVGQWRHLTVMR